MLFTDSRLLAAKEVEAKAKEVLAEAVAKRKEIEGCSLLQCEQCKGVFPINSLKYIQTHWYVRPHGCTGGDYWNQGEWVCGDTSCQHINRLYQSDIYGHPEVVALKGLFKTVEDTY
jgi:hypothetical protein